MTTPEVNLCSADFPVGDLDVNTAINGLSEKEKQYAAHMILAAYAGLPILFEQVSPESYKIHEFLSAFLTKKPKSYFDDALKAEADKKPLLYRFLEFAAQFYYNGGNYTGFGDLKIVPRCSKDDIRGWVKGDEELEKLCEACIDDIYDCENSRSTLGFNPTGCTKYYQPADFSAEEAEEIDAVLAKAGVRVENTVVARTGERYEVRVFSVESGEREVGTVRGLPVVVVKGLCGEHLAKAAAHVEAAAELAASEHQAEMLKALAAHYRGGDVAMHEKYSELWVKDIDPAVETYAGFIECYRDPKGVRCEFEGLTAAVDRAESAALHRFVGAAGTVLPLLPYPSSFERATFTPPSYNALSVLAMVTSGFPIGINIPNYDSIRQNIGFKNVSLTNVMAGIKPQPAVVSLIAEEHRDLYMKYSHEIHALGVAAHELYGHGSAKLLSKSDVESQNIPDLLNPGKFVRTFWPEGVSYDAAFGPDSSAFEECRAETTALYLAFFDEVLDIFDVPKDEEHRHGYILTSVYDMLLSALRSMWCYDAAGARWTQAHSRARFAILRAVLMWGGGAATLEKSGDSVVLRVDADRLDGVKDALTTLLKHLNFYKSAYLPGPGREFFSAITSMDAFWLSVKAITDRIPRKRAAYVGAVVRHGEGGLALSAFTGPDPTVLDVALCAIENFRMSQE